ncbi:hypothetical protein [Komagataeibacter xylinus]|uniref:hypothetical protein n=1 Tax=Komagataeibacter xylinus TaxID=28448 RepID=UPI0010313741|nr:hypothetical protein [Komagataeibacter xylinus]
MRLNTRHIRSLMFALPVVALSACGDKAPEPQDLKQVAQEYINQKFSYDKPVVTEVRDCAFADENKKIFKCHIVMQFPNQATDERVQFFRQDDKKQWVASDQ